MTDGRQHKLADIGVKHGISAERVRQPGARGAAEACAVSATPTWLPERGLSPPVARRPPSHAGGGLRASRC
ncbi:hypothetical protein [Nocardioides convexus]|uniref:hypothetical protein n=1 Tax=Nocardioides convexus TaxID=2712224 RepID=UPI0024182BEF|nr:hypothetical protein [Nocardioides convexus]